MKIKKSIKKLIINLLFLFRCSHYKHQKNKYKIAVLMLHGVMEKSKDSQWVPLRGQLSPNDLKRTLSFLSIYYNFITVDQAVDMLEGKLPFIDNGLVITFDDGYRNTINYGLPICEEFGIKPILFIATGHIDSGLPFWFDRLDYALQQNMGKKISVYYNNEQYKFDATSRSSLRLSFKEFRDECKNTFTDEIKMSDLFDGISKVLESRSGKALHSICKYDDWSAIATWDDLDHCVKNNKLDIGSHTVDHFRLDRLSNNQVQSQLINSKNKIEEKLSIKCNYFCYPNGDYDKKSMLLVKNNGYKAAFTTDVGLCESKHNLMNLKRFNFPSIKTKPELLYILNSY